MIWADFRFVQNSVLNKTKIKFDKLWSTLYRLANYSRLVSEMMWDPKSMTTRSLTRLSVRFVCFYDVADFLKCPLYIVFCKSRLLHFPQSFIDWPDHFDWLHSINRDHFCDVFNTSKCFYLLEFDRHLQDSSKFVYIYQRYCYWFRSCL